MFFPARISVNENNKRFIETLKTVQTLWLRTFHLAPGLGANMSAGVNARAEQMCHSEMSQ